ncbi:glycosyltransferase family 9 protein [Arenibacter aquaticus]|uniref:Glycosyltransferase family 9 protein n=2 Tax=Arenibacter aquaticus TaxID=2489054 RepID=A0A430K7D8_9FLAO|nr:glycosyltransferase family 9 protein [Arenibacter aquaticus]
MGDVAMTIPVLSALIAQHPGIQVTVLTRAFFKPLFYGLDNVSVYEADVKNAHKGLWGLWKLYKELKTLNIDMVADLHNVLRSKVLKLYFKLESIPFVQIDKGRAEKKALTSPSSKVFKPLKSTHQRYADVFKELGLPLDLNSVALLPKRPLATSSKKLVAGNDRIWIGIAPFAAFQGKMYPLDLMEKVVDALNCTGKYQLLLFGGGEKEKKKLDAWDHKFHHCVNLVGKLPFPEELALISHLQLMVAMDSGNAHLASMFGVPTLSLWGVTHPYAGFYPFGQEVNNALLSNRDKYPMIPTSVYGNKCPDGYKNVMRSIAPEAVVAKIEEILNK